MPGVSIIASGDLDEWKIAEFRAAGACIDGYGIGTQLVTGAPVNGVYKLVEIDDIPVMKESPGKITYPGRKQIFRRIENGIVQHDRLGLIHETPDHEQPLMQLVFKQGQRVQESDSLSTIAQRTAASVSSLPPSVRDINQPQSIPLDLSDDLLALVKKTQRNPTPS